MLPLCNGWTSCRAFGRTFRCTHQNCTPGCNRGRQSLGFGKPCQNHSGVNVTVMLSQGTGHPVVGFNGHSMNDWKVCFTPCLASGLGVEPPPPPPQISKEIPTNQRNKSADRFFSKTGSQWSGSQSQAPSTPSFWLLCRHVETQNVSIFTKKISLGLCIVYQPRLL